MILPSSVSIANAAVISASTVSFVSMSIRTNVMASIQSLSIIICKIHGQIKMSALKSCDLCVDGNKKQYLNCLCSS